MLTRIALALVHIQVAVARQVALAATVAYLTFSTVLRNERVCTCTVRPSFLTRTRVCIESSLIGVIARMRTFGAVLARI